MTDERAVDSARRAAEAWDKVSDDWEPIDADIPVVRSVAAKDPGRGHFYVSIVKSILRIVAGIIMLSVGGPVAAAGGFLLAAEVLGIVEELV